MTDKPQEITKAFQGMLTQAEVNYVPLSATRGKACANCRWFMAWGACFIVQDRNPTNPEPILATGYCDRWEGTPTPPPPPDVEPIPVVIVNADSMDVTEMSHEHTDDKPAELIINPAAPILTQALNKLKREPLKDGATVLKDSAGQRYMFMVTSNGYKDRDNAHVTQKAIEQYVEKCWTEDGQFIGDNAHYIWHTKELGSVSDLMFADVWSGFLVELWREKADYPVAKAFYNYVEKHPEVEWGASQGFFASQKEKAAGVYKTIAKYESSSLPLAAASNVYTLSEVLPMVEKGKRDTFLNNLFKEEFGIEDAAQLLKQGPEQLRAKLADQGIEAKSLGGDAVQKARGDAMKQSAELLLSMVEVQDAIEKQVEQMKADHSAALKEKDDRIVKLEKDFADYKAAQLKDMNDLRTVVNQPPRRPSQDDATLVTKTDGEVLKDALPKENPVGNWLGLPMKSPTT